MRLVLKEFQTDAVDELVGDLRRAASEVRHSGKPQAVGLSSPTGSGKTVMATAAMERILQGDAGSDAAPDATFLWITDQPQLNEQTRRKMLKDSSLFRESNLVTVGTAFDQETFTPGTVNFLNIQKLGKEKDLITKADERHYTIWETITNTVEAMPDRFFVIIDEAHRGMTESATARKEAQTIIQKFIKGSPDEIPKIPLILGISATPERFNSLVGGAGRILRPVEVPVEQVRASGLLKEVVTLYHPTEKQPTDITMLREAARSWRRFQGEWETYSNQQGEPTIRPILVIQVQDAAGKKVSKTDLDEAVKAIEDEVGGLPSVGLAHAFQEGAPVSMNGKDVRYLAPSDIAADPDVQIVFFKTSLNTGWDCPRAEVMMSFRTAADATSIAQLVGRMVRTPLARRIESNDTLNGVSLYLPHYDKKGLDKVIARLTTDTETLGPVDVTLSETQVEVYRAAGIDDVFAALGDVPTYIVPTQRKTSQVRRLMKLARALSNDEIADVEDDALEHLTDVLREQHKKFKDTEQFAKIVDGAEVTLRSVDWNVGLDPTDEDSKITLKIAAENIDDLFEASGRRIGDEGLHKAWWKLRRKASVENLKAKLELVALSVESSVRKALEDAAMKKVDEWLRSHRDDIKALPDKQKQVYEEVRGLASKPELRDLSLPETMTVPKDDMTWDRHIYVDTTGKYPAKLNKWETAVVEEELNRDKNTVWLRNMPRKKWAITIPYRAAGKTKAFYPDFLFVRIVKGKPVIDLLDPHLIELADAPGKAVGLAEFAAQHAYSFGRIELIIVNGDGDICRIDVTDERKRNKVLGVTTKQHLADLFEQYS